VPSTEPLRRPLRDPLDDPSESSARACLRRRGEPPPRGGERAQRGYGATRRRLLRDGGRGWRHAPRSPSKGPLSRRVSLETESRGAPLLSRSLEHPCVVESVVGTKWSLVPTASSRAGSRRFRPRVTFHDGPAKGRPFRWPRVSETGRKSRGGDCSPCPVRPITP